MNADMERLLSKIAKEIMTARYKGKDVISLDREIFNTDTIKRTNEQITHILTNVPYVENITINQNTITVEVRKGA